MCVCVRDDTVHNVLHIFAVRSVAPKTKMCHTHACSLPLGLFAQVLRFTAYTRHTLKCHQVWGIHNCARSSSASDRTGGVACCVFEQLFGICTQSSECRLPTRVRVCVNSNSNSHSAKETQTGDDGQVDDNASLSEQIPS